MVAAIIWLSLTPSPPALDFKAGDKIGHLAAYSLLMLWFCLLYLQPKTRALYGLAFVMMGVGLEILQGMLGFRTYDVLDMAANSAGVLLGGLTAVFLRP